MQSISLKKGLIDARLSAMLVQAAEQIVVLDNGQVAEVGSHKELIDKKGRYARLVSTQSLSLSNV